MTSNLLPPSNTTVTYETYGGPHARSLMRFQHEMLTLVVRLANAPRDLDALTILSAEAKELLVRRCLGEDAG